MKRQKKKVGQLAVDLVKVAKLANGHREGTATALSEDITERKRAEGAVLSGKVPVSAEAAVVLPDGTINNTQSIGHPIPDERSDVVEFVGASIEHHRARQPREGV